MSYLRNQYSKLNLQYFVNYSPIRDDVTRIISYILCACVHYCSENKSLRKIGRYFMCYYGIYYGEKNGSIIYILSSKFYVLDILTPIYKLQYSCFIIYINKIYYLLMFQCFMFYVLIFYVLKFYVLVFYVLVFYVLMLSCSMF